ncbi:MAG: class I SAM-dependent methyltransferase [Candidatus Promineofilum sp.]|nr:class I SAM-dependent methyltransferase [Promineifilum sp.]
MNPKETVRSGYERAADAYLADRPQASADIAALDHLLSRLASGAWVLDAGCGAGVPIAQRLSRTCRVVGVDFSERQLALAAQHVPTLVPVCQDLTRLGLAPGVFDAIVSYYAIIHIPRAAHAGILADFYRLVRPGGLVFLCLGAMDIADDVADDFYGVRMYWSHYDAPTNLALMRHTGFEILWSQIISDSLGGEAATGGHLFVLGRRPPAE